MSSHNMSISSDYMYMYYRQNCQNVRPLLIFIKHFLGEAFQTLNYKQSFLFTVAYIYGLWRLN